MSSYVIRKAFLQNAAWRLQNLCEVYWRFSHGLQAARGTGLVDADWRYRLSAAIRPTNPVVLSDLLETHVVEVGHVLGAD